MFFSLFQANGDFVMVQIKYTNITLEKNRETSMSFREIHFGENVLETSKSFREIHFGENVLETSKRFREIHFGKNVLETSEL